MTDTPLLMVDVETSGLNEYAHQLLEVGFAVVNTDLEITARRSWVIHAPNAPNASDIRDVADPVVQAMHDASGLWAEHAQDGPPFSDVADAIAHWVTVNAGDPAIPLCGSSVAFDARWLAVWLPDVIAGRNYRLPDPSGLRELLDRWAPHIVASRPPARKLHRVDPDIEDTLAELRHYRVALGLVPDALHPPERTAR